MRRFALVAQCVAVLATIAVASPTVDPEILLAPGYLSKAATLGKQSMLAAMRAFTHAGTAGTPIPAAPHCIVGHEELIVSAFDFDHIEVTPSNGTAVLVDIVGIAPLQTTTVAFNVSCGFDGVFASPLQLPQTGTISFEAIFAPRLSYEVIVQPTAGHNVTLAQPQLTTVVDAIATYGYTSEGFALDLFVASYFKQTVAAAIQDKLTAILAAPAPFANAWYLPAFYAMTPLQFVCGTGALPQYQTLALYMEPGCTSNTAVTATESLLASNDILAVLPSSPSAQVAETATPSLTSVLSAHVATLSRPNLPRQEQPQLGSLPATCSGGIPCPAPMTAAGGLTIAFSNCTICYPDNGAYTELAMTVTMSM